MATTFGTHTCFAVLYAVAFSMFVGQTEFGAHLVECGVFPVLILCVFFDVLRQLKLFLFVRDAAVVSVH